MRRISRWGMESGGLRALSILTVQVGLFVLASFLAWQIDLHVDVAAFGVAFCALELALARGLALTAGIGYLADLFSGQPHGLWMTGAVAAFAALRLFVFRIAGSGALTVGLLTGFAVLVAALARAILQLSVGRDTAPPFALASMVLLGGALGPGVYALLRWASDRFKKRD